MVELTSTRGLKGRDLARSRGTVSTTVYLKLLHDVACKECLDMPFNKKPREPPSKYVTLTTPPIFNYLKKPFSKGLETPIKTVFAYLPNFIHLRRLPSGWASGYL